MALAFLTSCRPAPPTQEATPLEIHTPIYDLLLPAAGQKALLVLFPCFGCDAADTREESKIPDEAVANGTAVLLMNFNRHLLMSDAEQQAVIGTIRQAVKAHGLDASNTFIGGFSSGGNVAVLLAKALQRRPDQDIILKGVFAVDSPLDLAHLFESSELDLAKATFPKYKGEARMITALLDSTLGNPADNLAGYERFSPMMNTAASVEPLRNLPIRFYTEPDTAWWRKNRGDGYEELNAYALKRLNATLRAAGNVRAEYITTEGRGFQHGKRHPHAWSIVDAKELMQWINSLSK